MDVNGLNSSLGHTHHAVVCETVRHMGINVTGRLRYCDGCVGGGGDTQRRRKRHIVPRREAAAALVCRPRRTYAGVNGRHSVLVDDRRRPQNGLAGRSAGQEHGHCYTRFPHFLGDSQRLREVGMPSRGKHLRTH